MTDPEITPSESQRYANSLIALANAETRRRSERQRVQPRLTRQRGVFLALAVAVPILVTSLMVNFRGAFVESWFEPRPPAAVARKEAQKALDALVGAIDAFRKDYDELPQTLVEIGVPSHGTWKYVVSGSDHYRVRGRLYGQAVSFDSITRASIR